MILSTVKNDYKKESYICDIYRFIYMHLKVIYNDYKKSVPFNACIISYTKYWSTKIYNEIVKLYKWS